MKRKNNNKMLNEKKKTVKYLRELSLHPQRFKTSCIIKAVREQKAGVEKKINISEAAQLPNAKTKS